MQTQALIQFYGIDIELAMYKRLQNQSTTCCNRQLEPHMIFCPMCGNKVDQSIAVNDITGQLSIFKSSEIVSNDNEYYIQDRYFLGYALLTQ